jgi:hypothetical protein
LIHMASCGVRQYSVGFYVESRFAGAMSLVKCEVPHVQLRSWQALCGFVLRGNDIYLRHPLASAEAAF